MGKKLSNWEKRQRDLKKEQEATASRSKTAARREEDKLKRDATAREVVKEAADLASIYNALLEGIINVSAGHAKSASPQAALDIPTKIRGFKFPDDLKYLAKKAEINDKTFYNNPALKELEKNKNIDYETFKNKYGSFFGNLFGGNKKKHNTFVQENEKKYYNILKKEEKRKEDFKDAIEIYKDELNKNNLLAEKALIKINSERKIKYDQILTDIEKVNEEIDAVNKEIDKRLKDITSKAFVDLFTKNLPLSFDSLDENAKILKQMIKKDLDKKFYASPSNNIKYGFDNSGNKLNLFITYKDDYFPFPSEQQVNQLTKGFSVTSLTKKNRAKIEDSFIPGIVLTYASYAFNATKNIKQVVISVGKDTVDHATGKDFVDWEKHLLIEREKLLDIKFDKIIPSETLRIFETIDNAETEQTKINWISTSSSKNEFADKFKSIELEAGKLIKVFNNFKDEKFKAPEQKELKNALDRAIQISGKKAKKSSSRIRERYVSQAKKPREMTDTDWNRKTELEKDFIETTNFLRDL